MTDALLGELIAAWRARKPCALVTLAATKDSVPREAGAKMLVYRAPLTSGTIGGEEFEALAIADALACLREKQPFLQNLPPARERARLLWRDLRGRRPHPDRAAIDAGSAFCRRRRPLCAGDRAPCGRIAGFSCK